MENVNVEVEAALAAAAAARPRPRTLLARLRRGRRLVISVGYVFSASSIAGLICTTIPGHAVNPYVAALGFTFLTVGMCGILLGVAAPDLPAAEMVVERLE